MLKELPALKLGRNPGIQERDGQCRCLQLLGARRGAECFVGCWWWCSHPGVSNSCDSMHCNPPGSSDRGIPQARILEWVAISPGDLSWRRIEPRSPSLQVWSLSTELPGKFQRDPCIKSSKPGKPGTVITSNSVNIWARIQTPASLPDARAPGEILLLEPEPQGIYLGKCTSWTWGTWLGEGCEKLGWKSGQISWRRHCEWELQGSREAREKITGIDNGAHAGRGVVNQSRRLLQTQHFTVVGVRNSKYVEGLLWARQLLQVNQWAPLYFSPHQPFTSSWLLMPGQRVPCRPLPASVCSPDWASPFASETQLGGQENAPRGKSQAAGRPRLGSLSSLPQTRYQMMQWPRGAHASKCCPISSDMGLTTQDYVGGNADQKMIVSLAWRKHPTVWFSQEKVLALCPECFLFANYVLSFIFAVTPLSHPLAWIFAVTSPKDSSPHPSSQNVSKVRFQPWDLCLQSGKFFPRLL